MCTGGCAYAGNRVVWGRHAAIGLRKHSLPDALNVAAWPLHTKHRQGPLHIGYLALLTVMGGRVYDGNHLH